MFINLNRSTSITFPAWYNSWRMAPKCPPEKNPPQQWTDPSALSAAKASGARVGWVESSKVKLRGHAWILRSLSSFSRKMYIKGCRRPGTLSSNKIQKKNLLWNHWNMKGCKKPFNFRWYQVIPNFFHQTHCGCFPNWKGACRHPHIPHICQLQAFHRCHQRISKENPIILGCNDPAGWNDTTLKQCFNWINSSGVVRRLQAIPIAGECSISITMYII